MWVQSLCQEDPMEEGMATHSSVLAWRTPWTEEPGGYSPWGSQESDTTEHACTVSVALIFSTEECSHFEFHWGRGHSQLFKALSHWRSDSCYDPSPPPARLHSRTDLLERMTTQLTLQVLWSGGFESPERVTNSSGNSKEMLTGPIEEERLDVPSGGGESSGPKPRPPSTQLAALPGQRGRPC